MNKSLFSAIVVGSVATAIAVGVATGPVVEGWVWGYFGLNIVWGEIGLAVAMLVTFPVLRRWDLVAQFLLGGWFFVALFGLLPAVGYRDIQLYRDGSHVLSVADLGKRHIDQPVRAQLTGVWRDDLQVRGTYAGAGGVNSARDHCLVVERHFCRVPVVPETYLPGDPVLAVDSHCSADPSPHRRTIDVVLVPAAHGDLGRMDFEATDWNGSTLFDGLCTAAPPIGHADLTKAAFRFDGQHGFLIVRRDHEPNPIAMFVYEGLCVAGALGFAFRKKYRRTRIKRHSELPAIEASDES